MGIVEIVADNAGQPGSWVVTHSLTMLASLAASAILRGEHIYHLLVWVTNYPSVHWYVCNKVIT